MLSETGHLSKVERKDEVGGFAGPNELEVGEVVEGKLGEVGVEGNGGVFSVKRDDGVGERHENGSDFHMNEGRFAIENEQTSEFMDFFNVVYHVYGFALIRIKFFEVFTIDLKLVFGVQKYRRFLKVNGLPAQQPYALLILLPGTAESVTAVVVIFETEIDAFGDVFAFGSF